PTHRVNSHFRKTDIFLSIREIREPNARNSGVLIGISIGYASAVGFPHPFQPAGFPISRPAGRENTFDFYRPEPAAPEA
ncbi:hypothetical protein, partial [Hoeflea sp. BAL378]|uniref:hypothetical protein n=1 Tax=Hoeflea sp. BAL378 TaxID=1547437 RepID=UPI001AEC0DC8